MTLLVIHTIDDCELIAVTDLIGNVETIVLYAAAEVAETEAQS